MGFWRSLFNFISEQRQLSREREMRRQAEARRLRSIQRDGEAYGYGYQRGIDNARSERPKPWENKQPTYDTSFWNPPRYTPRATSDAWFGEPERKKKRRNDSFW